MKRLAALFLSAVALFACAEFTRALTVPPNQGPVVTNPMLNYDQYSGTTRLIHLSDFFADPDATAAARITTPFGSMTITLDGQHAPATVSNFLNYVNSGRYFITDPTNGARASTFFHRSVSNFIIQGGGFLGTVNTNLTGNVRPTTVLAFPAVVNEPFISNTRGTIAMAKLGTDPNSATSQWFINLKDNSGSPPNGLDFQNGGFTAFGHVTGNGMSVADAIAVLPKINAGSPFDELPVRDYVSPNPVKVSNLVSIPELTQASPLAYTATSSNPSVATVSTSDGNLLVMADQIGTAEITVTGFDLDGAGPVTQSFTVNVISAPGRLRNIATRLKVGGGDEVMIAGFIIRGGTSKQLLVRAVGPSLHDAGIENPVENPTLRLLDGNGQLIASNDDWIDSLQKQDISDLGLAPHNDKESALLVTVPSSATNNSYSAIMEGGSGVGLIEVFDVDYGPASTILNLSTRGKVGTDPDVMIGGVILGGGESKRIIFRAAGPSLAAAGITSPLADPRMELRDSNGVLLDSNDDWQNGANAGAIEQAQLQPHDPKESAMLATLGAGRYTAIVSGSPDAPTGVAIIEVFQIP